MSSLEKYLFSSLAHFLIGLFIFLELSCRSCLYVFEINFLSVASFAISFLPFWRLSFHLAYSFLHCAKAFKFNYWPDYPFCFFRYVNAFNFISLEKLKTFEEFSPNGTSLLDVSNRINLLSTPRAAPHANTNPNCPVALGHQGPVISGGWNDNSRGMATRHGTYRANLKVVL